MPLRKSAVKLIHAAIADLFARTRKRMLGRAWGPKRVIFGGAEPESAGHREDLTLPAIFEASSRAEGFDSNDRLKDTLAQVVDSYLTGYEHVTRAKVVHAVDGILRSAPKSGVKTDLQTVLGGELAKVFGEVGRNVKRLVETEATRARNVPAVDAANKTAAVLGIGDPAGYFVVVRDGDLCAECRRLHLLPDGVTPRAWKLSELVHGYHRVGDPFPSVGGEHPHCRCSWVNLAPGYGFTPGGMATYVSPGHDELARQRA